MRGAIAQADRPGHAEDREDREGGDQYAREHEAQVRYATVVFFGHLLDGVAEAPLRHDVRSDVARGDREHHAEERDYSAHDRPKANEPGDDRDEDDRPDRSENRVAELREEHVLLEYLGDRGRLAFVVDHGLDQALGRARTMHRLLHAGETHVVPQDQCGHAEHGRDVVEPRDRDELHVGTQLVGHRHGVSEDRDEEPVGNGEHADDAREDDRGDTSCRCVRLLEFDPSIGLPHLFAALLEDRDRGSDEQHDEADAGRLEGPGGDQVGEDEHASCPEHGERRDLEGDVGNLLRGFADLGELLAHAVRAGARERVDAVSEAQDRGYGCGIRVPSRVAGCERVDERNARAHKAAGMLAHFLLDLDVGCGFRGGDATHLPIAVVLEGTTRSRQHATHLFEDLERRLVDPLEQTH